jgi:hypothetical protein
MKALRKPCFAVTWLPKIKPLALYSGGELVGFTTLRVFSANHNGIPIRIVYSGDTIVDRQHWGQQELAFAWIARIGEIKAQAPECAALLVFAC